MYVVLYNVVEVLVEVAKMYVLLLAIDFDDGSTYFVGLPSCFLSRVRLFYV